MASTLHVVSDERARDEAIAMIRLSQDPFELVAKRAYNILRRHNLFSRRVARGRGCFVVAPKSSSPPLRQSFFRRARGARRDTVWRFSGGLDISQKRTFPIQLRCIFVLITQ